MKKRTLVFRLLIALMLTAPLVSCASTPKQESTGEFVDDSIITTKIKSLLANDSFLKSFEISVETRKGIVQLSGFVDSKAMATKAGEIARGVEGVKSVENSLIVK